MPGPVEAKTLVWLRVERVKLDPYMAEVPCWLGEWAGHHIDGSLRAGMEEELEAEEVLLDKDLVGHTRAGTARDKCDRMGLVGVGVHEDVKLVDNSKEVVGTAVSMAESEELDRSGRSGRFAVAGPVASVVVKHKGSGVRVYDQIYLARHRAVEDCLDMAKDERLANHFDAYRDPNATVHDRTNLDGGNDTRSYQTHPANQRTGVEDHTREQPHVLVFLFPYHISMGTSDASSRVLPPFCQAILLSYAMYLVGLSYANLHQPLLVEVHLAAGEGLVAAMGIR